MVMHAQTLRLLRAKLVVWTNRGPGRRRLELEGLFPIPGLHHPADYIVILLLRDGEGLKTCRLRCMSHSFC